MRAAGKDVIGLGAGNLIFDTPNNIKKAAMDAIEKGDTKYTAVDGTPTLKKLQWKNLKRKQFGLYARSSWYRTGGKQAIIQYVYGYFKQRGRSNYSCTFWVSYPDMVLLAGGKPKIIKCEENDGFKLPQKIKKAISKKTKWLILNSPSNPTGAGYTKEEIENLSKVLLKNKKVFILSDDIYEHIKYDNFNFLL